VRISVHVSGELQALKARLQELPAEVRKQIRQATKTAALPIWREEVAANVHSRAEGIAFGRTARVAVSDRNVQLQAARIGKPLSGGLDVKSQWQGLEFGGEPNVVRTVDVRNARGTQFTVKRHTQRQLRARKPSGYVVYPAVAKAIPRLTSLWVQTVQRAGAEAHEGI
jgi:hypothetical protein